MANRLWNALKRVNGKDFRTFLIFLLISTLVWQTEKLRQTYPEDTELNIVCENVPEGYITPPSIDKSVKVRLEADGFCLLRMYLTNSRNLKVNVESMPRLSADGRMWALFLTRRLAANKTDLPEHVRITDVFTDTVMIPLLTVKTRRLPVVVRDDVSLRPQCVFSSPRKVEPDSVWLTATNDVIDTIRALFTVQDEPHTLGDTLVRNLSLILPDMATATATSVRVEYDVEPFSEKKMQIPVIPVNLPRGYTCRIFPPNAKVSFYVGLSQFEAASEDQFNVVADFTNIHPGDKASRVRLLLQRTPPFIQNVTFSPSYAEFILEKK